MSYPGNEALSEEIRERILNTFRQTLDLVAQGNPREAELGCEFVLRLDPQFEPARILQQRLAGGAETADVSDLLELVGGAPAPAEAPSTADSPKEAGESAPETASGEPFAAPAQAAEADEEPGSFAQPVGQPEEDDALADALDLSALDTLEDDGGTESLAPIGDEPATDSIGADGEPVAALDSENESRIAELLDEGQQAFDRSEFQTAIDSWSRIFLIDIDHAEANRRIELARKLKAEVERKVDEAFHAAVRNVETGELDEARAGFQKVLQMLPGHMAAQEYLDRLNAPDFRPEEAAEAAPALSEAEAAGEAEAPPPPEEIASPGEAPGEGDFFPVDDFEGAPGEMPAVEPRAPRPRAMGGVGKADTKPPPNRKFLTLGIVGLLVLALAGWYLFQNWNNFFPNATDAATPTAVLDPIERAKKTYAEAGAAIAIAQLRRMPSSHPQYAEAQALLAQWEAALDTPSTEEEGPDPELLAARDDLVAEAQSAFENGEYLLSRNRLHQAAEKAPLDADADALAEAVREQLDPIRTELEMFEQSEWQVALRSLWRMWEDGNRTPDVQRLMIDSYYNLAVRDLQRGDIESALANLNEAAELAGADPELQRLIRFATIYGARPQDLLYRIFVKYLPFR